MIIYVFSKPNPNIYVFIKPAKGMYRLGKGGFPLASSVISLIPEIVHCTSIPQRCKWILAYYWARNGPHGCPIQRSPPFLIRNVSLTLVKKPWTEQKSSEGRCRISIHCLMINMNEWVKLLNLSLHMHILLKKLSSFWDQHHLHPRFPWPNWQVQSPTQIVVDSVSWQQNTIYIYIYGFSFF